MGGYSNRGVGSTFEEKNVENNPPGLILYKNNTRGKNEGVVFPTGTPVTSDFMIGPVQVTVQSQLCKVLQKQSPNLFKPVFTKSCSNATVINVDIPKQKIPMDTITVDSSDSDSDSRMDVTITHICKPVTGLDVTVLFNDSGEICI